MRASIGSSTTFRLAGAVAGLWLCGAGAAWAGDGADLGSLQALLSDPNNGLCKIFNMSSCPEVPTITQGVLQVAGLGNNLPEMVRAQNNIPPGSSINAGNPAAVPTNLPVNSSGFTTLPLASTTPATSDVLATLIPLAFVSQSSGTAQAAQLYNTNADTFLYAVGVSSFQFVGTTGLTDPDVVYFFYEDLARKNQNFNTGQTIAKFSFPLTVLSKDTNGNFIERAVPSTLNFTATNAGDCSASTVAGNFSGAPTGTQTLMATQIGIDCAVVSSRSPITTQKHAIFEVAVPLLVTGAAPPPNTDPAYFYSLLNSGKPNPINTGVFTAFLFNDANGILPQGASIGLAPTAGPLGPPPAGDAPFALCAALPANGNGLALRPAVGAYYSMATSGEMLLSAPLPSVSTSFCPPL